MNHIGRLDASHRRGAWRRRCGWPCNWGVDMRLGVAISAVLIGGRVVLAQSVSLPLEGYYRMGRYMPIRVKAQVAAAGSYELTAPGMVPIRIRADRAIDAVVPALVVRSPVGPFTLRDGSTSNAFDLPTHPLGEEQKLVAVIAGENQQISVPALGGANAVVVRPPGLLQAKDVAPWECLDTIFFAGD